VLSSDNSHYEKCGKTERCIDDEIPFEIPASWVWVRLGEIASVSSGKGLTSSQMKKSGEIPVYGGNGITGYHDEFNVNKQTLIIGRVGFYCGSTYITTVDSWITDNALILSFSSSNLSINWLKYFIDSQELRKQTSSTAQPLVSGKLLYPILFPLPPLVKQNKIVESIDTIFSILDRLNKY